jgi:hypothetical protein
VKYAKPLFGVVTVLGIIILSVFFAILSSIDIQMSVSNAIPSELWNYFMPFCLFGGLSLLIIGICGFGKKLLWHKTSMKHVNLLFGFLTVLGLVLVTILLTIGYWAITLSEKILIVNALLPSPYQNYFAAFSLIGGTGFLTVGILGIGRRYFKNHTVKFFFTAVLVPLTILISFFLLPTLYDPIIGVPERMTVTQASVDRADPLTVSLRMKSFYSNTIYFEEACIIDDNQTTLASIEAYWITVEDGESLPYQTPQYVGKLPGGSDELLTLNFNTTLPSGIYAVRLRTHNWAFFVSPAVIIP